MDGHPFRDAPTRQLPSSKLAAGASRRTKFFVLGTFTVFWNVICAVIFAAGIGAGEIFLIGFAGLFVAVGLGLIVLSIRAFLAIFNPVVELFVSQALPALGDTVDVRWRVVGKASRIRVLRIQLLGVERATYRRGTDTTTDVHTFARLDVASTAVPSEIVEGAGTIVIPAGAVPTFKAKHNQILWTFTIAGSIPNWPDVDDEVPVEVVANRHHRAQREAA